MAESFLHLELDHIGIKAKIVGQDNSQTTIQNQCHIMFNDLPDTKSGTGDHFDNFNEGLAIAAQKLDFALCSKAIVFVSDRLISFRNLELPFNSEKKIKQILPFELENQLFNDDEIYISDFHLLNSTEESNMILSASLAESLIEKYFLQLDEYNIKPIVITPLGYAAAIGFLTFSSRLKTKKKIETFAFIHANDLEITLVLIKERKPCTVRTIANSNISSDSLATIVDQTIIGFNQRTGENTKFDVFVCLDKDIRNGDQISNAFATNYESKLTSGIETNTDIDSDTMLSNILPEKPAQYLFNFCKGKYGASSFIKTYSFNIAVSFILLVLILGLIITEVSLDIKKLEEKIAIIDNKALTIFNTSFPDKTKIYDPYLQMKANIQAFMKKSKTQNSARSLTGDNNLKIVKILGELSRKIDDSIDIDITRFLYNTGRLVISGSTDNFNNVDKIKNKIESSHIFRTVNISSATADNKDNRVKFKFIIEM